MYIYSVDTSAFYNENELEIHKKLNQAYRCKHKLKSKKNKVKDENYIETLESRTSIVNEYLKRLKSELYELFKKNKETRLLRESSLVERNVISVFDSVLTRTLGISEGELTTDVIVVQTYFFQVLEHLIEKGFYFGSERYICFTASAGQIRTKKTIFIKESVWNQYQKTLTCGLTVADINSKGGMNTNKYLAYLALCNSATDQWKQFNIRRAIVVDDLETMVSGIVDSIDDKSFEIERREMSVPIPHTDGCGMILPKRSKKSFMVRLPFIKGLLVPFDFYGFAEEHNAYHIQDIYGKTWDLSKDDIDVIFTKSQFKMWSYYADWEDYQDKFTKYKCQAAKCNVEEEIIPDAKLNYQMIQTLSDITDEELRKIAKNTLDDIHKIAKDKETMLRVLGAHKNNINKNYLQKSLELYPSMLNDPYSRDIIKSKKKSMVKEARSAKLRIQGKYTFIIPDLYAFCEFILLKSDKPKGLLKNGEVFCNLYQDGVKLDCLRSPHLYCEHSVRINSVDDNKKKWFITKGIYTSIHDLISRELQFDCDGDKSLVCKDETLVEVAERNMKNIVPLYYEMASAQKDQISSESIYSGLQAAYKGNIGIISNDISKIWNSKNVNIQAIKWLTAFNNYVIDYAKSLYLPTIPDDKKKIINSFTRNKVPYFFRYAKDKKVENVQEINDSAVNKLRYIFKDMRINFDKVAGVFDYTYLLNNKNVEIDQEIVNKYIELDRTKKWRMKNDEQFKSNDKIYVYKKIREELLDVNSDETYVTDVLVTYLYENEASKKETLWKCFGEVIYHNLTINLKGKKGCESCGILIEAKNNRTKYCSECWKEKERELWRNNKKKRRNVQV